MGRRRNTNSQKQRSGQVRLDQLLTPRRSSRQRNNANLKQSGNKSCDDVDNRLVLEVESRHVKTDSLSEKSACQVQNQEKVEDAIQISEERQSNLLKCFDLNPLYGPCRGISRRERYLRAVKYDVKPAPEEIILQILDKHSNESAFQMCVWDQHKLLTIRV